jgi:hypothetical protein
MGQIAIAPRKEIPCDSEQHIQKSHRGAEP